jgi:hypothetical protein
MNRTTVISLLVVCFFAGSVVAAEKTVTVRGEVVDTFCYASMGAKGSSHAQCGIACAKAGIPVGLVEGKKLHILLPAKDKQSLPAAVTDKMGKVVSVTGHSYTSGGVNFLTVESVK